MGDTEVHYRRVLTAADALAAAAEALTEPVRGLRSGATAEPNTGFQLDHALAAVLDRCATDLDQSRKTLLDLVGRLAESGNAYARTEQANTGLAQHVLPGAAE